MRILRARATPGMAPIPVPKVLVLLSLLLAGGSLDPALAQQKSLSKQVAEQRQAIEAQLEELKTQLYRYKLSHVGRIHTIASSNEAKILLASVGSERHPDLLIYLQPPPEVDVWSLWVPTIVIEVVSESSRKRDYEDKPDEYLEFGVDEYWIVDAARKQITIHLRWRGQWKKQVVKPPKKYSTRWLPGFSLDLKRVIAAAAKPKTGN